MRDVAWVSRPALLSMLVTSRNAASCIVSGYRRVTIAPAVGAHLNTRVPFSGYCGRPTHTWPKLSFTHATAFSIRGRWSRIHWRAAGTETPSLRAWLLHLKWSFSKVTTNDTEPRTYRRSVQLPAQRLPCIDRPPCRDIDAAATQPSHRPAEWQSQQARASEKVGSDTTETTPLNTLVSRNTYVFCAVYSAIVRLDTAIAIYFWLGTWASGQMKIIGRRTSYSYTSTMVSVDHLYFRGCLFHNRNKI